MNEKEFKENEEVKEEGNKVSEDVNESYEELSDDEYSQVVGNGSDLEDESDGEEDVDGTADGDTLTPSPTEDEDVANDGLAQGEDTLDEVVDEKQEKMVAQSKVNEIAARARQEGRESAMKELLAKYGVSTDTELDDLFGKGQSFVDLDNDYNLQGESYRAALAENALLKCRIDMDRWEDVKLILGGKGLDVTPENIESYVVSHPEWRKVEGEMGGVNQEIGSKPILTEEMAEQFKKGIGSEKVNNGGNNPAVLRKLGNEASPEPVLSEEEMARKLYGFK